MRLADIAPRLGLARDQWISEQAQYERRLRRLRAQRLQLQRLVAHRELQMLRGARHGGRYLAMRGRKRDEAIKALDRIEDRCREAGI